MLKNMKCVCVYIKYKFYVNRKVLCLIRALNQISRQNRMLEVSRTNFSIYVRPGLYKPIDRNLKSKINLFAFLNSFFVDPCTSTNITSEGLYTVFETETDTDFVRSCPSPHPPLAIRVFTHNCSHNPIEC